MKWVMPFALLLLFLSAIPRGAAQNTPSAVIQNDSSYVDTAGYFHVVGEVLNTGDVWLDSVRITGTLRESNKQTFDVTYTYASSNYLAPGTKGPFNLVELNSIKSSKIANYTLALDYHDYYYLDYHVVTSIPDANLAIQSARTSYDPAGDLNVVGEVNNIGTKTSTFTQVVATYYDKSGKVIFVDFTYTTPTDIPPGQTYGFKIIGPPNPASLRVTNYTLFAQSQQYTSVPESHWPIAGTITTLALIGIAIRKKRAENHS